MEEFFTAAEELDMTRFHSIGVIKTPPDHDAAKLKEFEAVLGQLRRQATWTKNELVGLFRIVLPDFAHKETGKNLNQRM